MTPKTPSVQAPNPAPAVVEPPKLSDQANFYLIITPGFEDVARAELLEKWPDLDDSELVKVERGGLEVRCEIARGFAMNRELRTPTRVLLRLADFGCRDFPKLFKKVANFPWEIWLGRSGRPEFQATSRRSRLKIKKRIEETCRDGFKKRMKTLATKPSGEAEVVFDINVRLESDVCFISLDTSGETLHKRGDKTIVAEAPLRETLAASLLRLLMDARDWQPNSVELIDPMTGSGTFLLEAALIHQPITGRDFAFEQMPLAREMRKSKNSSALTETTKQASKPVSVPVLGQTSGQTNQISPFASFVGFEMDKAAAGYAKRNLEPVLQKRRFQLREEDFFASESMDGQNARPKTNPMTSQSGDQGLGQTSKPQSEQSSQPTALEPWLIVNPPYGERLKIQGSLRDYYESLFRAVERVAQPARMLFILPAKVRPTSIGVPRTWKLQTRRPFLNGGVEVEALVFVRKN